MPYFFLHNNPPTVSLSSQRIGLLMLMRHYDAKPDLTIEERLVYTDIIERLDDVTVTLGRLPSHPLTDQLGE